MNHNTSREGPAMETLQYRLQQAPSFFAEEKVPTFFYALIHDVVFACDTQFSERLLQPFSRPSPQCRWYSTAALMAYFLGEECFAKLNLKALDLIRVLSTTAELLSQTGKNRRYLEDVDRREEFIRVVLQDLGLRPQGETEKQAEHRLQSVSSAERLRVIEAARAAEERARIIREELAKKRAQEAADKMSRE